MSGPRLGVRLIECVHLIGGPLNRGFTVFTSVSMDSSPSSHLFPSGPNTHFQASIVLNFSWDGCNTQEN